MAEKTKQFIEQKKKEINTDRTAKTQQDVTDELLNSNQKHNEKKPVDKKQKKVAAGSNDWHESEEEDEKGGNIKVHTMNR